MLEEAAARGAVRVRIEREEGWAMAVRTARATWEGSLVDGAGRVTAESSGVLNDAPVTWASRTEEPGGRTSPEELIAAAHAACFAMELSHQLTQRGNPPSRLDVRSACAFEKVGGGFKITTMDLEVGAEVPGMDEERFREALAAAEQGCPVSVALRGGVKIEVTAGLR